MHIITFFIAWKSKYLYLCDFSWFFRVFGATPRCFPHVVDTDMLFSAVFSMFLDSNLPTTPSVNWKMCFVFGLWLQKKKKSSIIHYMYGTFWDKKCHIHVRSEFSILRHKKYNLIFTMLCSGVDKPECTHTQIRYEYSISRGLCQSPPIDFFRCICFESRC